MPIEFVQPSSVPPRPAARRPAIGYFAATLACAATTVLATLLARWFDLANIVMLFLLTVVLVAVKVGRGPAILASFLSVALFDFFFVPPRFSFSDVQRALQHEVFAVTRSPPV